MDVAGSGKYTVKQVAALTGVRESTLRVWEKRYGVVEPERSGGGYRLYSDEQIALLRSMAALVADGVPASTAARTLAASPVAPEACGAPLDLDLVGAAASLAPARLDQMLEAALGTGPAEHVIEDWLLPELVRLGQAWERGEVTVAHEHFASAGVVRALGSIFRACPAPDGAPTALVGLPPGGRHELGLLAFAVCLRRAGVDVVYLGADVPVADWAKASAELLPRAAVVAVTQGVDVSAAQAVIDAMSALRPPIAVWVGGGLAAEVAGARALPHSVTAAATHLADSLRAGSS